MRPIRNFENVYAALKAWATKLHAERNQTWAAGLPYSAHLQSVEDVLSRFGFDDMTNPLHQTLRLAAWSHDLLEDCEVCRTTLRVLQGPEVEALVWAVTDEPGVNRAERHRLTYPKIAGTPWATCLKLSDRISNTEASIVHGSTKKLAMYCEEYPEFRSALFTPGGPEEPMWAHLDDLTLGPHQEEALVSSEPVASAPIAIMQSLFEDISPC